MKGYKNVFSKDYAVSEIVGAILLVLIAVIAFSALYMYLFPPAPEMQSHVKIVGDVNDEGLIVLYHKGGAPLTNYTIIVRDYPNGNLIGSAEIKNDYWNIDTCRYPFELINVNNIKLINETDRMKVEVYNTNRDHTQDQVFSGVLNGKHPFSLPPNLNAELMLISSLRTDSIDEDIICFTHTINANINPSTYIYRWMVNSNPLAELLMPFDTSSSTTAKDYSGNKRNGTVIGPTWINGGIVGGAYQFNGINDRISIPYCFDSSTIDKITVETWVKTTANSGIIASFDRNNYWELGFINGKVKWSTTASDGTKDTIGKTNINDGIWHQISTTYDYLTGECTIYIDGKQDTTEDGHRLGELLGLGGMPQGYIGTSAGTTRETIFSTGFEKQEERNNWSENNSGPINIKDCVDNDVSNVDGFADKGTETNFTNAQGTSPDTNVMTLQEANQFAVSSTLGKTSGSGTSYTTIGANQMYGQVFTASSSGEIYQATFYGRSDSSTYTRNAKIVICDSSGNILTNGVSSSVSVSTTAGNKVGTWSAGSRPTVVNGNTYWIMVVPDNTIRIYYDATTGGTSKADTSNSYTSPTNPTDATSGTTNYRLLYADINNLDYEIDFEYQWTAAVYNMANEQVCIYVTSHTGPENLLVNYWTGSAWSSLGTITGTGWSNFTATGLTSSTYTIQLKGTSESSGSSQDSWNIDVVLLHLWITQGIFDILPSTTFTPHYGSYSIGGSGDFDPYYTAFNRTGINISNYKNVRVSVWYSYKNTESNDFLGLYYKNNTQWNPIFEVNNPTQSGQKPWTQVIVNIPKTLGVLQLQFKWRTTSTNEYVAIDDLNITGVPLGFGDNFSGVIDEFCIYNRVLSSKQIYQEYLCKKDGHFDKSVIVSDEIKLGDIWKCVVTPNDGAQDDDFIESNSLQILRYGGGK